MPIKLKSKTLATCTHYSRCPKIFEMTEYREVVMATLLSQCHILAIDDEHSCIVA